MVDEFAVGDRGGTASAETREEKEEVEILNGRHPTPDALVLRLSELAKAAFDYGHQYSQRS